jgi:serine/threonine protein kinase
MGRGDDATEAYGFDTVEDAGQGVEPGALVGEYRIEGELGAGGMGRVYAAIHPVIAKRAAIKVLHPELSRDPAAVERFVREARVVNEIGHPNIVDIFAFGTLADGRNYFVMEQLRGESLKARMQRARLSLDEVRAVLATIATALEAAHKVGVVHRDLKPDNVFLVDVEDAPAPSRPSTLYSPTIVPASRSPCALGEVDGAFEASGSLDIVGSVPRLRLPPTRRS